MSEFLWIFGSVILVSVVSLVGVVMLSMRKEMLKRLILYLVSFAAGTMLGGAFLHLLPEAVEEYGFVPEVSFSLLAGIMVFFVIEKIIHWHHCHRVEPCEHKSAFGYMNLVGDGVHNFVDGLVIAGSYIVSIPLGITTTIAILFHEIPQEIGDFGVLIQSGFSTKKALAYNFLIALTAVAGAGAMLLVNASVENIGLYVLPFTAGGFVYIASSDLIPELHRETGAKKSFKQLFALLLGILVMFLLTSLG